MWYFSQVPVPQLRMVFPAFITKYVLHHWSEQLLARLRLDMKSAFLFQTKHVRKRKKIKCLLTPSFSCIIELLYLLRKIIWQFEKIAAIEAFAKMKGIKSKRFAGVDQAQTIYQGPPSLGLSKTCKIFLLVKERNHLLPLRIMLAKRIQPAQAELW